MWVDRVVARRFRNLLDLDLTLPPDGAVFLGPNAHGKTSILECLYYPVLFRSFRAASDQEVCGWDEPGFHLALDATIGGAHRSFGVGFEREGRRKRVRIDGADVSRITDGVGQWLAVAFLPSDPGLVQGPASERRRYLDRVLSLADPRYLRALIRFRRVLGQRNAALRAGRAAVAGAFAAALKGPGAYLVRCREDWVRRTAPAFTAECEALGEAGRITLRYRGEPALAEEDAWERALAEAAPRELARGMSLVGPQRDDLVVEADTRSLRDVGSTGQQRSAAVALKLCELATLRAVHAEGPALLLDDVFAELDGERQARLGARLRQAGAGQVFITAPRRDELPRGLDLEVFEVRDGGVRQRVAA